MKNTLVIGAFLLATAAFLAGAAQFTVSGRVLDPSDSPIHGVRIQAYRDNRSTGGPVTSDASGEYKVEVYSGPPLDTVRYDQSDWFPGTVEHISGKNNH